MGARQRSKRWPVVDHVYDLGPAMGVSGPAARRRVDRCVREKLSYLVANAADPCIGLTDAGRALARDGR